LIRRVKVKTLTQRINHHTRDKIGHFEDVLPSQPLGTVLQIQLNLTQQNYTYINKP